jgi:hypothetical protein
MGGYPPLRGRIEALAPALPHGGVSAGLLLTVGVTNGGSGHAVGDFREDAQY